LKQVLRVLVSFSLISCVFWFMFPCFIHLFI
jgi:hypothetical protein